MSSLNLEEVVRQHFGGAQHPNGGQQQDAGLRYTEALAIHPDKGCLPALHSNRSLAYCKAQRYGEALADGDAAAALAPGWHKAHWRRAAALQALKRLPEAVLAYRDAWKLAAAAASGGTKCAAATQGAAGAAATPGDAAAAEAECAARLRQAVHRLTREQLAACILGLLEEMQQAGQLRGPEVEAASEQELQEAQFRRLKAAHQGQPRPGPYYARYLQWLREGLSHGEAYSERAALHAAAKCYLQARADAQAAVAALRRQAPPPPAQLQAPGAHPQQAPGAHPQLELELELEQQQQLARAYQRLGQAYLAERRHEDRDCFRAARAFMQAAAELDGAGDGGGAAAAATALAGEVQDGLQEASEQLTMVEIDQIQRQLYHEGAAAAPGSSSSAAPSLQPGQRCFQARLSLAFPGARASDCSSRARELLRCGIAAAVELPTRSVTIERVMAPSAARRRLLVEVHVQVGADLLKASSLVRAVTGTAVGQPAAPASADAAAALQQLVGVLGSEHLVAVLGQPDLGLCSAEVEDVTPACCSGGGGGGGGWGSGEAPEDDADVAPGQDRRLAVPARPKLELELPYRMYRLVRADGAAVERPDKHPFCMSRVYYDPAEKPEEVWAELADGSCRWRQTGGEVKVLALRVPPGLPSKHLAVDLQPYSLKGAVWNRASSEVYLEGELERGVVPEECFWTHCGGEGEDGCALYLRKMNLELLQRHWMHSEMWWPRLLRHHGQGGGVAWDDYEKDYSDLPEEVLQRHRVAEAIKDDERRVETAEKGRREALQERDDLRKRTRQERLHQLRTGERRSWVELDRALPAAVGAC